MARKEIVVWTDDVTGEQTEDVIHEVICLNGDAYAVDMSPDTHAAYLALIEPYRAAGTRIGRASSDGGVVRSITSAASSVARTVADKAQNKAVREWWGRHGSTAGLGPATAFGRIPESVQEAFHKHGGRAPIVAAVLPAKTPRKARTVGADARVERPRKSAKAPQATFSAAPVEAAQRAATPRKRRGA